MSARSLWWVFATILLFGSAAAQPFVLGQVDTRAAASGAAAARTYNRLSTREVGDDRVVDVRNGLFIIVRRPWVQEGEYCTSQVVRERFVQIGHDGLRQIRATTSTYVHVPMARNDCERLTTDFDVTTTATSAFEQPGRELNCSDASPRRCIQELEQARQLADQHRSGSWQNAFFSYGRGYTRWSAEASDRDQPTFDTVFDELFSRSALPIVTIETNGGRFDRIECARFDWPDHGAMICRVGEAVYVDLTSTPFE